MHLLLFILYIYVYYTRLLLKLLYYVERNPDFVIWYCNPDLFLNEVVSNTFKGTLF